MASIHPRMSKQEADALFAAAPGGPQDGQYLFRVHSETETPANATSWVLSVVFRGKPTHHLVAMGPARTLLVNNKHYGDATTLPELVALLRGDPPANAESKWPVKLTTEIPPAAATVPIHPVISKESAEALLLAEQPLAEGRFLLRARGDTHPWDCFMAVIYRGRATHHLCTRATADSPFVVNGSATAPHVTTFDQLVAFLRTPHAPWWPVALTQCVAPGGTTVGSNAAAEQAQIDREAAIQAKAQREKEAQVAAAQAAAAQAAAAAAAVKAETPPPSLPPSPAAVRREVAVDALEPITHRLPDPEPVAATPVVAPTVHVAPVTAHRTDDPVESTPIVQSPLSPYSRSLFSPAPAAPALAGSQTHPQPQPAIDVSRFPPSDGQLIEVVLTRPSLAAGFGFGVASVWRVQGAVNVISFAAPEAHALALNDMVVSVNGRDVSDMFLDDLKAHIKGAAAGHLSLTLVVYRPYNALWALQADPASAQPPAMKAPAYAVRSPPRSRKCSHTVYCSCESCSASDNAEAQRIVERARTVADNDLPELGPSPHGHFTDI